MKFAETLASQITPEWRTQYLRYEEMKHMLYQALESAPVFDGDIIAAGADADDRDAYQAHIQQFQDQFFSFADRELTKVNTFFSEKLSEGLRKFSWLKSSVKYFQFKQQESSAAASNKSSRMLTSVASSSEIGNGVTEHATASEDVESGNTNQASADGVIGTNWPNSRQKGQSDIVEMSEEPRIRNGDAVGGVHHVETIRRRRGKIARFIPMSEEDRKQSRRYRKINDLKLAFSEFYLSLILLQNYQNLNYTAFRKIMKKHDKLFKTSLGSEWKAKNVDSAPFFTSKEIDRLIVEVENMVTVDLEGGDRQRAMKRLRVPPLAERTTTWDFFRNGFALGSFAVLLACVIICTIAKGLPDNTTWDIVIRMYRGHFFLVIFVFLSAFNVNGWANAGVNHVLIFELNPRNHLSHHNLLEIAGVLANLWCITFLGFLFSQHIFIPQYAWPLVLLGIIVVVFACPFKVFYYGARKWLLYELFRCVAAPFFMVTFADFWLADQLNSLVVVLRDLQYLICFYAVEVPWWANPASPGTCNSNLRTFGIRPLVAAFPAWIRFAQCLRRYRDTKLPFPHLLNAAKYATSFLVVLFSTLDSIDKEQYGARPPSERIWFYAWILSAVVSSCFGYGWDVKMDWGFFDRRATHVAPLLREDMVYSVRWFYYFAILEDFVLRFAWVISISVGEITAGFQEYLLIILGILELVRRFIWNYFRLENEHLNNCGQFRAVRDISIAPVKRDDLQKIEDLMDMEDGMYHGRYANVEDDDQNHDRHNHKRGGRAAAVLFTKHRRHTLHAFSAIADNDDNHKLLSPHRSKKSSSKRSTSTARHQKKGSASVKYAAITKTHSSSPSHLHHHRSSISRHDEEDEDEASPLRTTRPTVDSLPSPPSVQAFTVPPPSVNTTTSSEPLIINVAASPRTSDAAVPGSNTSAVAVQQLMSSSGKDMRRLNSSSLSSSAAAGGRQPQFARQTSRSSAASGSTGGSQLDIAKNPKKHHHRPPAVKPYAPKSAISESRSSITDEAIIAGQQRRSRHLTQSRVSSTSSTTSSTSSSPHAGDETAVPTSKSSDSKRASTSSSVNKLRSDSAAANEGPLSVVGARTEAQQREQPDAASAASAANAASVAAAGVRAETYADRQEKEDAADAAAEVRHSNRAADDDFDFSLSVDDAVMSNPLLLSLTVDDDHNRNDDDDVVVVYMPTTASNSGSLSPAKDKASRQ